MINKMVQDNNNIFLSKGVSTDYLRDFVEIYLLLTKIRFFNRYCFGHHGNFSCFLVSVINSEICAYYQGIDKNWFIDPILAICPPPLGSLQL